MAVTVRCKCGKADMLFHKLNPGEIETFDCGRCEENLKAAASTSEAPKESPTPKKPVKGKRAESSSEQK